jgi:hypothetical protein
LWASFGASFVEGDALVDNEGVIEVCWYVGRRDECGRKLLELSLGKKGQNFGGGGVIERGASMRLKIKLISAR